MFEHSVKVPRLYKTAAKIAERVKLNGGSVKQVYDEKLKHRNIKALYALIISAVQNDSNLEFLLKKSELLQNETRLDPWLAKVLITELLWGKKRLPGESKPVKTILAYQEHFNSHLSELEQPRNKTQKVDKPRYVRVNTLKISINDAVDVFRNEDWVLCRFLDKHDYSGFISKISNLEENEFMVDIHVPYLLIFPPRTEFYNHHAYKNGLIALQDKASCLPAHILNPSPGSKVLDMCASPGMKTTQLACIINGSGVIYAIERDSKRAEILRSMIENSGAQDCVQVVQRDVLDVCKRKGGFLIDAENSEKFKESDEKDEDDIYRTADFILIDPSCSGSGMVDGPEKYDNFRTDQNRLKKLAGFQIMILKHALRAFPSAKRVVYSTCSLNVEENEEVVRDVLQSTQNFKLVDAKSIFEPWTNFGSNSYGDIGSYCLYSRPEKDLTNGFFVAVFDRLESFEENQFLLQREQHFNSERRFKNRPNYSKNEEDYEDLQKSVNTKKTEIKELDHQFIDEVEEASMDPLLKDKNKTLKKKKKRKLVQEREDDVQNKLDMSSQSCDVVKETKTKKQIKKKQAHTDEDSEANRMQYEAKNDETCNDSNEKDNKKVKSKSTHDKLNVEENIEEGCSKRKRARNLIKKDNLEYNYDDTIQKGKKGKIKKRKLEREDDNVEPAKKSKNKKDKGKNKNT